MTSELHNCHHKLKMSGPSAEICLGELITAGRDGTGVIAYCVGDPPQNRNLRPRRQVHLCAFLHVEALTRSLLIRSSRCWCLSASYAATYVYIGRQNSELQSRQLTTLYKLMSESFSRKTFPPCMTLHHSFILQTGHMCQMRQAFAGTVFVEFLYYSWSLTKLESTSSSQTRIRSRALD